jgi:hypothetical protein
MYKDIELQGDRWEEEQKIIQQLFDELVEDGIELRIFNEETKDGLPF